MELRKNETERTHRSNRDARFLSVQGVIDDPQRSFP